MPLTEAEELSRDTEIARLEWEVCQAAVHLAETSDDIDHRSLWELNEGLLLSAARALIKARRQVETQVLLPS